MSAIAWGKTGRVALDGGYILLDREKVGFTFPSHHLIGRMRCGLMRSTEHHYAPSRDAAVMWVLRRVDPKLWREERGEVWRVHSYGRLSGLHVINPRDGQCQGCYDARDLPRAITRAHREACEAYL